jgi:hypothetical protein
MYQVKIRSLSLSFGWGCSFSSSWLVLVLFMDDPFEVLISLPVGDQRKGQDAM